MSLYFKWLLKHGGVEEMSSRNDKKSKMLYDFLDSHNHFYKASLDPVYRSRMNVVFKLPDESLNDKFLEEASHKGICGIGGHREVGGCRVSLYNAVDEHQVTQLISFLKQFSVDNHQ